MLTLATGLRQRNASFLTWAQVDLRHTWASLHAQNGTSLQELQELGGWSCTEMVQRYAHLGGEHVKAAASRIDGTNLAQSTKYGKLKLVVSR